MKKEGLILPAAFAGILRSARSLRIAPPRRKVSVATWPRLLVFLLLTSATGLGQADFPLELGETVTTCFPGYVNNMPSQGILTTGDVLVVHDPRDPATGGPFGGPVQFGASWDAPEFHNEMASAMNRWNAANLGQVFGIALDDAAQPNIYLAAGAAVYEAFLDLTGPSAPFAEGRDGPLGPGGVYQIDGALGCVNYWVDSWNGTDYDPVGRPNEIPNTGPGLGNIAYDPENRQLFVSNFEDGMIYRISAPGHPNGPGMILSLFDHGVTGRAAAGLPTIADNSLGLDPANPHSAAGSGFTPLGRRVWAVGVHRGRVYYSVWNEDEGRVDASLTNDIWSVGLNSNGDFATDPILEIAILPYTPNANHSNPVSDIAFSSDGMLLSERVRSRDYGRRGSRNAHRARVLEYTGDSQNWSFSQTVFVGYHGVSTNASGGVDYGYGYQDQQLDLNRCHETIWSTGDALDNLAVSRVYGLQAAPATGNSPRINGLPDSVSNTSYFIDLDRDPNASAKTQIGDVEVYRDSCDCLRVDNGSFECFRDAAGRTCYVYEFEARNLSGEEGVHVVVTPDPDSPSQGIEVIDGHIDLSDNPIPNMGSRKLRVVICLEGDRPPTDTCLLISVHNANFEQCCSIVQCVRLPECCSEIVEERVSCSLTRLFPLNLKLSYSLTITNLSSYDAHYAMIVPASGSPGLTISPSFIPLNPPLPNDGSTTTTLNFEIEGGAFNQELCFKVILLNRYREACCSFERCFTPTFRTCFNDYRPVSGEFDFSEISPGQADVVSFDILNDSELPAPSAEHQVRLLVPEADIDQLLTTVVNEPLAPNQKQRFVVDIAIPDLDIPLPADASIRIVAGQSPEAEILGREANTLDLPFILVAPSSSNKKP